MILLFLLLFLISMSTAYADTAVHYETRNYSVQDSQTEDLFDVLARSTPIVENGKHYYGYTWYSIYWYWETVQNNGRCAIGDVNSTVNIEFTLPRLNRLSFTTPLARQWHSWVPDLLEHEQQHANYAIKMANLGEKKLNRLVARKSCAEVHKVARELSDSMMIKLKNFQEEFDRLTDHGAKKLACTDSVKREFLCSAN